MTTVLVAGGAGYIGSHTVKALIRQGFEVVVFDNLSAGRRDFVRDAQLIEGDLMDRGAIAEAFKNRDIAAVLHFASLIQVGESYADPRKYYRGNLVTSLNLLDAMLEAHVDRFIFSSSAAVYGVPTILPIPESHPLDPINPYGRTKAMVERILGDYERAHGLRYVSFRYFNAAGADPEGELGEEHVPETHLIPNVLFSILGKKDGLDVFGTDFATPDGTAIRDYIHVSDLAEAHVLALWRLLAGETGGVFNLGTNRGYSVREVIARVEDITGLKVPGRDRPRRQGDVPVLLASKEKAERLLGWTQNHSDMTEIIETAWNWHRRYGIKKN